MPGLLIKDLPPHLHQKLKEQARSHHRSMTREALAILETALISESPPPLPAPVKGRFPLTQEWLDKAIRESRS